MIMCILWFHKWGKWEQYVERGTMMGGLFGPKKPVAFSERRQKRQCKKCKKVQDERID